MLPFKCYLNCELEGCHPVKRLRILKNVNEKYLPIIFYPIMGPKEILRVYISLEQTEDFKVRKSKNGDKEFFDYHINLIRKDKKHFAKDFFTTKLS